MRHLPLLLLLVGCPKTDGPSDDSRADTEVLPDTSGPRQDTGGEAVADDSSPFDTAGTTLSTGTPDTTVLAGPTGRTADTIETGPPADTALLLDIDTADTAAPLPVPDWTACPTALPTGLTEHDALWTLECRGRQDELGGALHLADVDGDGQLDVVTTSVGRLVLMRGPLTAAAIDRRVADAVIRHPSGVEAWPGETPIVSADLNGDGRTTLYVGGTLPVPWYVRDLHTEGFTVQVPRRAWTRGTTDLLGRWEGLPPDDDQRPLVAWSDADGPGDDALVLGMPAYDPSPAHDAPHPPGGLWIERDAAPRPPEAVDDDLLSDPATPHLGGQLIDLGDPDASGAPEWAVTQARRVRVLDAGLLGQGGASATLATITLAPSALRVIPTLGGGGDVTGDGIPDLVVHVRSQQVLCGAFAPYVPDTGSFADSDADSDSDVDTNNWIDTDDHTGGPCDTGPPPRPRRSWTVHVFEGPVRGDLSAADAVASLVLGMQDDEPAAALTPGDLDGDGVGDLVLTTLDGSLGRVDVFPGPVSGTLALPTQPLVEEPGAGFHAQVGDLTGDGRPDLVLANRLYRVLHPGRPRTLVGSVRVYELCPAP